MGGDSSLNARKMKTDAWRGEAGGNGETGSRAGAGGICAPPPPPPPASQQGRPGERRQAGSSASREGNLAWKPQRGLFQSIAINCERLGRRGGAAERSPGRRPVLASGEKSAGLVCTQAPKAPAKSSGLPAWPAGAGACAARRRGAGREGGRTPAATADGSGPAPLSITRHVRVRPERRRPAPRARPHPARPAGGGLMSSPRPPGRERACRDRG